uniref:AUGMIN subunit 6-like n=1 Tax=Nelumbo nucifera TaxID=4432 RepID=A0A822YRY7_NELNU|nr:TPA_asm: hypothetical protein HUJ06_004971 [Nelumbo nucifera]
MRSNLAHEMTAEFRGLCAEEAYLQQELEKLQDLKNKAKLEGELWDDNVSGSLGQNSHLVSKATHLWESLLSRKGQHEVLASGPIEDLIAHREHRYRISGSSLLAAMDQSSQVSYSNVLSNQSGDLTSAHVDDSESMDEPFAIVNREKQKNSLDSTQLQVNGETHSWVDDRSGKVHPTVDIAEILRRWAHALQRIHKQLLHLTKANDGEGSVLLRSAQDGNTGGHAESLEATLAEHRQHLASIQVLINQLKEVAPAIQKSISELTEEVNKISSTLPSMTRCHGRSNSPIHAQSTGRTVESSIDEVADLTSKLSNLFSLTPYSTGKTGNVQKRHSLAPQASQVDNLTEGKSLDQALLNNHVDNPAQDSVDSDSSYVQNLRRSVREAAFSEPSVPSCRVDSSQEHDADDSLEHFFVPLSTNGFSRVGPETESVSLRSKQLFVSPPGACLFRNCASVGPIRSSHDEIPNINTNLLEYDDEVNEFLSATGSNYAASGDQNTFYVMDTPDQVFSPPLLVEASLLEDSYEDLLGMFT